MIADSFIRTCGRFITELFHREVLAKLDPLAVARYQITEKDIRTIEQYLKIIQADLELEGASLWQEIVELPTGYATSLVIHELVEIRLLQAKGLIRSSSIQTPYSKPWPGMLRLIFRQFMTNMPIFRSTSSPLSATAKTRSCAVSLSDLPIKHRI